MVSVVKPAMAVPTTNSHPHHKRASAVRALDAVVDQRASITIGTRQHKAKGSSSSCASWINSCTNQRPDRLEIESKISNTPPHH